MFPALPRIYVLASVNGAGKSNIVAAAIKLNRAQIKVKSGRNIVAYSQRQPS